MEVHSAGGTRMKTEEEEGVRPAPVKPSRVPTLKSRLVDKPLVTIRNRALYEDDGKDYTDYDQVRAGRGSQWDSSPSCSERGGRGEVLPQLGEGSASLINDNNKVEESSTEDYDTPACYDNDPNSNHPPPPPRKVLLSPPLSHPPPKSGGGTTNRPIVYHVPDVSNMPSYLINIDSYQSCFLLPENKPLEVSALASINTLLLSVSPLVIARHVTLIDVEVVHVVGSLDFGLGVTSGLELMTLPHGYRLRQDICER